MPHTKALIVQAAVKTFSEKGYQDAAMKDIAREAGVHETTLFRHFEGKDALLRAVIEWVSEDIAQSLADFPEQQTDNLESDLRMFAHAYEQVLLRHVGLIRLLISESGRRGEELKSMLSQNAKQTFMERLMAYLEEARQLGQIRPELNIRKVAGILTGIITIAVLKHPRPLFGDTLDDYFDVFIHGILVR